MPTKVRRNGPYAPLSAHYARDDAILTLDADEDDLAELLYLRCLAHCAGDIRLDGFVSDIALRSGIVLRRKRQQRVLDAAARLSQVCGERSPLIREEGGYRIRRWDKWNATRSEVEAKRETDRRRKGGRPSDQEGPGDEFFPPEDSTVPSDSARNPSGPPAESAGLPTRATSTYTRHDNNNDTAAAAAATGANSTPPLPPPLNQLRQALDLAGLHVTWDLDEHHQRVVLAAVGRVGIPALVKDARARHQPNRPAFSARAYLAGWTALQPRTLTAVPDPAVPCDCGAGYPDRRSCPDCRRNDSKVAS